ncbi:16S rRNA (uracil(1498)-N(3))-methyltransferase [Halobacillus litoralis]|uniref:16S rRNA (uracil(1498)-N(3))-methyltransferase n=1 Tax=Halobacillus litoralis TaxID=45668 RepID=UPI001CFD7495|nr:16S rRNA (uracil(1498)-N(3))-methyltransferase [Halobacillus litoralis]
MQRYFVQENFWNAEKVTIYGDDVHHVSRVMRMSPGDELIAIHPKEGPALCTITSMDNECVICTITQWIDEQRELPVHVTIVAGLGKGDKLEQVVQKGTELGASAFIPYQADRSVAKWDNKKAPKKVQRLKKIAKEASEQSERTIVPEVLGLHSLQELLSVKNSYDLCLFAYADEARKEGHQSLRKALDDVQSGGSVLVVFGPEGGFSEREVNELMDQGFLSVRLGPRILRMETAPLYFLSSISYALEESEQRFS